MPNLLDEYICKLITGFSVLCFLFLHPLLSAQASIGQYINKGYEAFERAHYNVAMDHFAKAISLDSSRTDIMYQFALASFYQRAYASAEQSFDYLNKINADIPESDELLFHSAETKMKIGKYDEAIQYYNLYMSEHSGEISDLSDRSNLAIQSAEWSKNQSVKKNHMLITKMDDSVNSPYSDHAPFEYAGELYFSSQKFNKSKDLFKPNRLISKILKSSPSDAVSELEVEGKFNSDQWLTSSFSINGEGSMALYTICDYVDTADGIHCAIHIREINPDGWGKEIKLPEIINTPGFTSTHPVFGPSSDEKQIIYFASNKKGGKGGMDLYSTSFNEKLEFSAPIPLDQVNTAFNELSPYYDQEMKLLYFSSDGRIGFGGYDIYSCKVEESLDVKIFNLNSPINSSYDDLYFSIQEERGYFSSNRLTSRQLDDKYEACCFDIYEYKYKPIDLHLLSFDSHNGAALNNTQLIISYIFHGVPVKESIKPVDNLYILNPKYGSSYTLEISKPGYLPKSIVIEEKTMNSSQNVYLVRKNVGIRVNIHDSRDSMPITGSTLVLYKIEGSKETQILSKSAINEYQDIEGLLVGSRYKLVVNKKGYYAKTQYLDIPFDDREYRESDVFLDISTVVLNLSSIHSQTKSELTHVNYIIQNNSNPELNPVHVVSDEINQQVDIKPESVFTIVAFKSGYLPSTIQFDTYDTNNSEGYTQDFVLKRIPEFDMMEALLPVKLYFDNDEPDNNTIFESTSKNYTLSYFFYSRRKMEFIEKYAASFTTNNKREKATENITKFFEAELPYGYDKLLALFRIVHSVLKKGIDLQLNLKSFASPVSDDHYNLALTKRRIQAVRNEIIEYENGILKPFLISGQLIFNDIPLGESQAPDKVNDNPNFVSRSVYSPAASKERRIEIESVNQIFNFR